MPLQCSRDSRVSTRKSGRTTIGKISRVSGKDGKISRISGKDQVSSRERQDKPDNTRKSGKERHDKPDDTRINNKEQQDKPDNNKRTSSTGGRISTASSGGARISAVSNGGARISARISASVTTISLPGREEGSAERVVTTSKPIRISTVKGGRRQPLRVSAAGMSRHVITPSKV